MKMIHQMIPNPKMLAQGYEPIKGKKYFESQVPFSNLSEVEEPF